MVADDFNSVLVGAYRTVGTEAVEFAFRSTLLDDTDFFLERQRLEGHIVHYADGKTVFRFRQFKIVIDSDNLCRACVLRRQSVTSAYDERGVFLPFKKRLDVHVQRLSESSRFFRTVENGDSPD